MKLRNLRLKICRLIFLATAILAQIAWSKKMESDEERVMQDILENYNKDEPPIDEKLGKTRIHVGMYLIQIIGVSEKKEQMATSMYMYYGWNDTRLVYNKEKYGGVNVSRIPADDVWVPDLILQNSKDKEKFDVSLRTDVLVYDSGAMEWLPPSLYSSSCEIQVELFPFDWQNCTMRFRSLSLDSHELSIVRAFEEIAADKGAFLENGEWDLIGKPVQEAKTILGETQYDEIVFYFILRRKPQFYIMNLIVPCLLMITFSCFTFFLPAVSGEKSTLSVSTLLGETVFLFLIAQRLPETSRSVPLLGVYLIFSMALIICCILFSVIVCNIHYRSFTTHRMPRWMTVYIMGYLARLLRCERPPPSSPWQQALLRRKKRLEELATKGLRSNGATWRSPSEMLFDNQAKRYGFQQRHVEDSTGFTEVLPAENGRVEPSSIPATLLPVPKQYKAAVDGINYIADHVKNEEIKDQSTDDWEYCAMILDRMFFWIYITVYILGTAGFSARVAMASYPEVPDS